MRSESTTLWAPFVPLLAVTLGVAAGVRTGEAAAQGPDAAPEELARLEYMLGTWEAERVEFLDDNGEVRRVSSAEIRNELALDGLVILHEGALRDPEVATRGWYYFDPADGRLHMDSVSSSGHYDEFVGEWDGDRLVMTTRSRARDGGPLFRMVHADIGPDSFVERMELSTDDGRSWRTSSRQVMRRVGIAAARPASLDAMDAYVGHWRSDDKSDRDGNAFHFEYDLGWMDSGRTIARLAVAQVGPGEARTTVFEGFKGVDPAGDLYYFAASPSGRGARGSLHLEGDRLVTQYEGWAVDGSTVEIRDVFEPPAAGGDTFVSRTYLRPRPGAGWQQIGEDVWTRAER